MGNYILGISHKIAKYCMMQELDNYLMDRDNFSHEGPGFNSSRSLEIGFSDIYPISHEEELFIITEIARRHNLSTRFTEHRCFYFETKPNYERLEIVLLYKKLSTRPTIQSLLEIQVIKSIQEYVSYCV